MNVNISLRDNTEEKLKQMLKNAVQSYRFKFLQIGYADILS